MVEKELQPELLQKQWSLIKQASKMADLQEIREVQEKFVQRFHFKRSAVKGMYRFMDSFMVSESQAASEMVASEKAASVVSSEHFMDVSGPFTATELHGEDALVQEPK
jgi:hypothetical protein